MLQRRRKIWAIVVCVSLTGGLFAIRPIGPTPVIAAPDCTKVVHQPAPGAPPAALKSFGAAVKLPAQLLGHNSASVSTPVPGNGAGAAGPYIGKPLLKLSPEPNPYAGVRYSRPPEPTPNGETPPPAAYVIQATDSASYTSGSAPCSTTHATPPCGTVRAGDTARSRTPRSPCLGRISIPVAAASNAPFQTSQCRQWFVPHSTPAPPRQCWKWLWEHHYNGHTGPWPPGAMP